MQEARLAVAMRELQAAEEELSNKEKELNAVKRQYECAVMEKQNLQADADKCRHKMSAAAQLINGLKGEKLRWTKQCKEFKEQLSRY